MLKVAFFVFGNELIAQIVDMSEGIRNNKRFTASNGIHIVSSDCPDITTDTLYIRGCDKSRDNELIFYRCANNREAMEKAKAIMLAVKEATKNENSVMLVTEKDFFDTVELNGTLKINMLKWQNSLIIKIIDINDNDRGTKSITHNRLIIKSASHPQLSETTLYVRGTHNKYDNEVLHLSFSSSLGVKKFADNIISGVKKWNDSTENTVQFYDFIPIF